MANNPFQKGHPGYFKGKKMNKRIFIASYEAYRCREVSKDEFAKMCGISPPTLQKRFADLLTNGYLPAYLFEDGKPLTLDGYDGKFDKYGETEDGAKQS